MHADVKCGLVNHLLICFFLEPETRKLNRFLETVNLEKK